MKKTNLLFLSALIASPIAFAANDSYAAQDPVPLSTDARIRTVAYNQNEVFRFMGHYGYQSAIEFEQGEDIRTVSVGDSTTWQMVPSGSRLFLKPVEQNARTNMMVVTSRRVYNFEIDAREPDNVNDADMTYVYRFVYPGETDVTFLEKNKVPKPEIETNPQRYNQSYKISGSQRISPIRIFDDGEFTFFQFQDINADIPAFFRVDSEGKEAIINYRTVGDYIVIERVTSQFTLRDGRDIVCVFNEAMPLEVVPEDQRSYNTKGDWWYRNLGIDL